ncbi:MAG: 1-acyl-sn-glycerol-3-phosphate acyltransferase [Sphingobacteriaceae bacterium]|nr:1-acyl-sn-glycerol-3-phosphate acyltransferase [Sphingobacteriaceae bacterium]
MAEFTILREPMKKDVFGYYVWVKRLLYATIGLFSYIGLNIRNRMKVSGSRVLADLPDTNVIFVSNHQTYYRDVAAMLHVICAAKWKIYDGLPHPLYLLWPETKVYYVAAEETMKESGWLPRLFTLAGAITVKRTWRSNGKDVEREVDTADTQKIDLALSHGWVITFPQGTTRAYAEGRKGTAHIIKKNKPVVVPVVINGFRRAFDKHGLKLKKKGTRLSVTIKPPLDIDYDAPAGEIIDQIMDAIEQSERFRFRRYTRIDH